MVSDIHNIRTARGHGRTLSWEKPVCISVKKQKCLNDNRTFNGPLMKPRWSGVVLCGTLQYSNRRT